MAEKLGGEPRIPATEAMLIIFPRHCEIITLPTAWENRNVPVKFVSITLFHCSNVMSSVNAPQEVPACIDPAEFIQSFLYNRSNTVGILDITTEGQRPHSYFLQLLGGLLTTLFFAGAQYQVGAHFRQAFRHLTSQADGASSDQGYAAAQIEQ